MSALRTGTDGGAGAGADVATLPIASDGSPAEATRLVALARALAEKNAQLEHALQSRIRIEQAKGMLAERFGIGVDDAFELLRSSSRTHRLRIHELARRVVDEPKTPSEIASTVSRGRSYRAGA